MKRNGKTGLFIAIGFLVAFAVWTVLVRFVGVAGIGPLGSGVGFAGVNGFVHSLIGVNITLYEITDWLGIVPIAVAAGFAVLGLCQWILRRRLLAVDRDVLALGVFYIAVIAVFLLFEVAVVNYRPVLIEGRMEASYPSSTTLLALCVMPTAAMQVGTRVKKTWLQCGLFALISLFTVFMVVARVLSGVHWITDIVGGALVATGLDMLYYTLAIRASGTDNEMDG